MADATGNDGAATEHTREAELATWLENAAAGASAIGNATEHAVDATRNDGAATEHTQEAQLSTRRENIAADASGIGNATEQAIAKWQAMCWRRSKDCQHVIQVVLSLRANANRQKWGVEVILARHLPRLFMPNTEDAFFAMLQQGTMTDASLRDSLVDFFQKWPHQHFATYQDLLADSAVAR